MAKISVIMPVYNKEKYLNKSINSILKQTFNDFELIIINDGSTDKSLDICNEFSKEDKRIKIISLQNLGVSSARNIGLDKAIGEYIQFIDCDDYIDTNMFNELNKLIEDFDPDIILSGITKVDSDYNEIIKITPRLKGLKYKKDLMDNFVEEQFSSGLYGCVSNKLIKRSVIENINLRFNKDIKLAEDLDFYLTLYNNAKIIFFENKSYYYYLQNAENSSTTTKCKKDYLTQIMIILKAKKMLYDNTSLNDSNEKIINKVITNFVLCYVYDQFNYLYKENKLVLKKIYDNSKIMNSLINNNQKTFKKIIIILLKNKSNYLIWILLCLRSVSEGIYRKTRYGIFNGRI